MYLQIWVPSVVVGWLIGLFFAFYIWSCAVDFFAMPEPGEKSDALRLVGKEWDAEVGLAVPGKTRVRILNDRNDEQLF